MDDQSMIILRFIYEQAMRGFVAPVMSFEEWHGLWKKESEKASE